jgi:3-dehydroquinate synthase
LTAVETIRVELGARGYDIHVGTGLLDEAGERIGPMVRRQPVVIVTDRIVAALHLDALQASLDRAGVSHETVILDAGEQTKEFAGLESLVGRVLDTRPERGSVLVALGGGVIGDITGFAASIVLRGIDFIQIPTTLLAQVDSAVGGKTGINTRHGKNLVGNFHQPCLVLSDIGLLDTLPRRELLAGYAEVVKYGLIDDAEFFAWLEANGPNLIEGDGAARRRAVVTSCRAKAAIVAADELEADSRRLLNLGHTFGHALEVETGFGPDLLHGEAVSIGMVMAFELSARLELCPMEDTARVARHLAAVGLPTTLEDAGRRQWRAESLLSHMFHDKKVQGGRITFVLARGIGQAFVTDDVAVEEVERLLERAAAA